MDFTLTDLSSSDLVADYWTHLDFEPQTHIHKT